MKVKMIFQYRMNNLSSWKRAWKIQALPGIEPWSLRWPDTTLYPCIELIRPLTDMNHIGSLLLYRKENYTGRGVIATTTVRSTTSSMNLKGRRPRISAASSQRQFWSADIFWHSKCWNAREKTLKSNFKCRRWYHYCHKGTPLTNRWSCTNFNRLSLFG